MVQLIKYNTEKRKKYLSGGLLHGYNIIILKIKKI